MPLREESGGLVGAGLSMIAQSLPYSKEHRDDLSTFGQQMGQLLTNRFQAQQVDDFINNEFSQFQNQQVQFYQALGTIEEPDQLAQAMSDWHYNTLMPFITKNSMKYATNPRIMEGLKAAADAHSKGFDDFIQAGQLANQTRQVDAQIDVEGKKADAYVSLTGQQIRESKAQEAANYATARYRNAQAANVGKNKIKFTPGADLATTVAEAQALDPKITGGKDGLDARTARTETNAYIAAHKNEIRPDGRRWGEPTAEGEPTEQEMAMSILTANQGDWQKKIIKGRIVQMHPYGPEAVKDPAFGGYFDEDGPFASKNAMATLRGAVPPPTLISVITATPVNELPPEANDVKGYVENVVRKANDPAQLGGHFQSMFLQGGLRRNEHNQVVDSAGTVLDFDEKDLRGNEEKLKQALLVEYVRKVRPLIADDAMSQRARFDADLIGAEAIARFLPQVAKRLEVPVRQPPPQKKYGDYVKQLLGKVDGLSIIGPQGEAGSSLLRSKAPKEGPKVEGYSDLY